MPLLPPLLLGPVPCLWPHPLLLLLSWPGRRTAISSSPHPVHPQPIPHRSPELDFAPPALLLTRSWGMVSFASSGAE